MDNPGFCIACGDDAEGVKPDARKYKCEHCGKKAVVYGADEVLLYMVP
jgi:DNA-directed RNA polymerase subunit RPC12/RpoP